MASLLHFAFIGQHAEISIANSLATQDSVEKLLRYSQDQEPPHYAPREADLNSPWQQREVVGTQVGPLILREQSSEVETASSEHSASRGSPFQDPNRTMQSGFTLHSAD